MEQTGKVELTVYNVKGQKVSMLFNEELAAGEQKIIWQGTDNEGRKVSSGIYFVRLQSDTGVDVKKVMLMK